MKASTFRRALAGCHNKATGGGETELWAEPGGAVSWGVDLRGRKFPVAADGPGCGGIRGDLFARSKAREEECEERPAAFERVSPRTPPSAKRCAGSYVSASTGRPTRRSGTAGLNAAQLRAPINNQLSGPRKATARHPARDFLSPGPGPSPCPGLARRFYAATERPRRRDRRASRRRLGRRVCRAGVWELQAETTPRAMRLVAAQYGSAQRPPAKQPLEKARSDRYDAESGVMLE